MRGYANIRPLRKRSSRGKTKGKRKRMMLMFSMCPLPTPVLEVVVGGEECVEEA